jgi:hypothetical protein
MASSRSAVPGPLYSLDPSEHTSGNREIGRLERRRRVGTLVAVEPGVNDFHFGFHCVYHVCIFLHSETDDSETRLASLLKQSPSGLATTFQLSEGLTALPHSSTFLERDSSGK